MGTRRYRQLLRRSKTYVGRLKHRNKKRSMSKVKNNSRTIVENTMFKWILQNVSENQTFQRTLKFTMAVFYEMDFMKGIVILVIVDEMCKILKSLLKNCFWSRDEMYDQSFLLKSAFRYPYVCYVPALLRGRPHLLLTSFYYFSFIKFRLSKQYKQ